MKHMNLSRSHKGVDLSVIADFIYDNEEICAEADKEVLEFIARFLYQEGEENAETIRHLFRAGYCYYFALMLKEAFGRGQLCIAAPIGHIVWVDGDWKTGIPYDIEGVNTSDCEMYIPIEELGSGLDSFMHVPSKTGFNTQQDIQHIMDKYRALLAQSQKN